MRETSTHLMAFQGWTEWWKLVPRDDLVSRGYVLTDPGKVYVVYLQASKTRYSSWVRWIKDVLGFDALRVDLSGVSGTFNMQWFNPRTGKIVNGKTLTGGAKYSFTPPFRGDAVLYFSASKSDYENHRVRSDKQTF